MILLQHHLGNAEERPYACCGLYEDVTWNGVIALLVINTLLFAGVIFTSYYRDNSKRLPTMNERVARQIKKLEEAPQEQASVE